MTIKPLLERVKRRLGFGDTRSRVYAEYGRALDETRTPVGGDDDV